jgi:hypothetical protein
MTNPSSHTMALELIQPTLDNAREKQQKKWSENEK